MEVHHGNGQIWDTALAARHPRRHGRRRDDGDSGGMRRREGSATDTPKAASSTTGTTAAGAPANGGTAKPAVQGTPVVVEGKADGTPVTGGSLTIAYDDVPTLDPRVSGATDWWRASYALFDPLIYQEPGTLKLVPGLAQSWQAADDGKSYTLKLRQDVKFHDGTPFNADAVKYTFDSIMDPALKSLTAIGYLGPYTGTDVIDPFTVKVNFKDAVRALPQQPDAQRPLARLAEGGQGLQRLRGAPRRHRAVHVQGVQGAGLDDLRAQSRLQVGPARSCAIRARPISIR